MKALTEALCEASNNAIRACALEYKFSATEAIEKFGTVEVVDGKSKKKQKKKKATVAKPELVLPFCGKGLDGMCEGIKLNRGLYTQCMMMPTGEGQYCTTCARQAASNANGLPNYGTVAQRIELGATWTDGKGKSPVNYGNIMLKLNITKEAAIAEAEKFGMTIPEEQFEVVKAKKGRPAKAKKEKDPNAAPKKRGRPKKTKKVVTGGTGDDLIANLVAQAQANTLAEVPATEEDDDATQATDATDATEEDDDATQVTDVTDATEEDDDATQVTDATDATEEDDELSEYLEVEVEKPKAKKAARKPKKTAEEKAAEKLAKAQAKAKLAEEKKAAKEAAKLAKAQAKAKLAEEKKAAKEAAKLAKAQKETDKSVEELQEMAAELTLEDHVETDEEQDDDDEVEVEKFEFEGTEYLRDGNGTVYDMESQEEIGTWDGKKLNPLAQDSEDDEDIFMA